MATNDLNKHVKFCYEDDGVIYGPEEENITGDDFFVFQDLLGAFEESEFAKPFTDDDFCF